VSDAAGPVLSPSATVGEGVRFGAFVVVHDGVEIGDGCVIDDHAILGRRPRLSAHSTAAREDPPALRLGAGATVGAGAVVFAGAEVGEQAIVGDQAFVRERARIGASSVVGRGSAVDNDVVIGERVRVQTSVYLTAYTVVEDDVFVGPGATTTNDNTMARLAPDTPMQGALLRRACRIGGAAVLVPGVEVGEEAFVAAGAVVTVAVPPRAVVRGVPARVVGEVGDEDLLERWR
jgi:acetyltransferase-like isoleucine patch superfamily enzyme